MNRLEACKIEPLDNQACRSYLDWVGGDRRDVATEISHIWLLAHCHDGVTWGRFDSERRCWRLSCSVFPDLCPKPSEINLLELRLFGNDGEILIWRTDSSLSGRLLIDEPVRDPDSPTRPEDEIRILAGDRIIGQSSEGFTRLGTASGTEQAVPLECAEEDFDGGHWPLRLKVRNYFETDAETGVVRVAASRLVDVFKEGR